MRIRGVRRALVAAFAAAAMVGVAACGGNSGGGNSGFGGGGGGGNSKTVTIGFIPWDEDVAVTEVWKQLLEKKGYTVNTKQLDAGPLFQGVSTGQLSAFFDVWLPTIHAQYWKQYGDKVNDLGVWFHPADVGLAVPDYVKIDSLAQLPSHASEFDGKITGIEASAGEMHALKSKVVSAYGLGKKYQVVQSSTPAMLAALKKAYDAKKPIVVTLWRPHWAFSTYKIHYLKDPKNAWGKPDKIHAIASTKFTKANPKVVKWWKNFKLTPPQLQGLEADIQKAGGNSHKSEAVKKWLAQNKSITSKWFE